MISDPVTPSLELQDDTLLITGDITFNTVVALREKGVALIATLKKVQVDLKGLKQSDSSGLAFCTALVRTARNQKKDIRFLNIPSFMKALMHVHGLDSILPT